MEYKGFVEHIATAHRIRADDMESFKIRLNNLRKVGIPKVESVGKGARVEFTADHLAEVHLGLGLSLSLTPQRVAAVVDLIRSVPYWWPFSKWTDHCLVVHRRDEKQKVAIVSRSQCFPYLKKMSSWDGSSTMGLTTGLRWIADDVRRFREREMAAERAA
jgi:hypothetical protein